ncbi:MAG: hypothetical protein ACK5O8_02030 [Pirellula sp.]
MGDDGGASFHFGVRYALVDEEFWDNETLDRIYGQIISLASKRDWVVGQGNLGLQGVPPAHPKLTECALTPQGQAKLDERTH